MENGAKEDSKPSSLRLYEVVLDDGPLNTKFWLLLNVVKGKLTPPQEDWLNFMNVKHVKELSLAEISKLIT